METGRWAETSTQGGRLRLRLYVNRTPFANRHWLRTSSSTRQCESTQKIEWKFELLVFMNEIEQLEADKNPIGLR